MFQSQQQNITDHNDGRKYFAQLPHIADDDLDMYEYRLYGHYVRVCGQGGGTCQETERTTYKHCGMSRDKFRKARITLAEKGFIQIIKEGEPHQTGRRGSPAIIAIQDIWLSNIKRYSRTTITPTNNIETTSMKGLYMNPMGLSENPSKGLEADRKGSETDRKGLPENPKKNKELIKTNNNKLITTTTPTHHPLLSSLPNSQSQEIVDDSNAQPIANAILDLFSADRAQQVIQEHGYDAIYRACCYVATANRDKPKDKHLTPRFVFAELSGAGNIPANYEPPTDYSKFYANADSKSEPIADVIATKTIDTIPEPAVVDKPESTKPAQTDMSEEQIIWQSSMLQFKLQYEKQYMLYLANNRFIRFEQDTFVIEVPEAQSRNCLQTRLYSAVLRLLDWQFDTPINVRFCIPGEVVTIDPPQPDPEPEPEKPKKSTLVEAETKHTRKSFAIPKAPAPDEKPVTAEQMMAGRLLFNQLVNKRKMESDVAQGKVVDLIADVGKGNVIVENDASTG